MTKRALSAAAMILAGALTSVLSLAIVGCVPLALLGWQSFAINRAELEKTVGAAESALARSGANGAELWVARTVEELRLAVGYLPYSQLDARELGEVLRIPFRQIKPATVLVVLDEDGRALAPPLVAGPQLAPERGSVSEADLDELSRRIPLAPALAAGVALGPPFRAHGSAFLPVALRVSQGPVRVAAAQLSLGEIEAQLRGLVPPGQGAWLLGPEGKLIAAASGGEPDPALGALARDPRCGGSGAARGPRDPACSEARLLKLGGEEWLAAAAPLGDLGWVLVVAQPARTAFHAAQLVRTYTLFWATIALLLTVVLGVVLARGLVGPIDKLSAAARALTEGRYDQRVELQTGDELGTFATAFNHMSDELLRRDREIRAWNAQLQQRVDERSAELKLAQDQILRARRLAALGSLGAGVVHELNNPVMGVLGIAELLKRELGQDPRHRELLGQLDQQARRISKIAGDLRRFSEQERTTGGHRFALATAVQGALELHEPACRAQNIRVRAELSPQLPEVQGDRAQLREAIAQLVQNAVQAMPSGGDLTVRLLGLGHDALKLTVSDTGAGVPEPLRERIFDPFFTTKDRAGGAGLGLSIAHTIITAHHGELAVDGAAGAGATFTVVLPAAAAAAHLS